MPIWFEKVIILSGVFAPMAIASVVVIREMLAYYSGNGRILRFVASPISAAAGIALVGLLLGPKYHIIYRRIDLGSLPRDLNALALAVVVAYAVALVYFLATRRMRGGPAGLTMALSPAMATLPFLAILYFGIENASPGPLIVQQQANLPAGSVQRVADRIDFVTSLTADSKGRIIFPEFRTGKINLLELRSRGRFKKRHIATVPLPVDMTDNMGLWHVGLDPGERYLYVTGIEKTSPATIRVVRFEYNDGNLGPLEVVLSGIPGIPDHYGGAIAFGNAGDFYLSVGDGGPQFDSTVPQVSGSVLRVKTDGGIPGDNPSLLSQVYAYGFRNPYGLAFHSGTEALYLTEPGPQCCDRVFRVVPGAFHGWPEYGRTVGEVPRMQDDPQVVAPIWDSGATHPTPTQLIAYTGNRYGDRFKGNLFFGTFSDGKLHRIALSEEGTKAAIHEIVLQFDRNDPIVGITEAPDGLIYFATTTAIYRVNSLGSVE